MQFRSLQEFKSHVHEVTLSEHMASVQGRRGGPARRKARPIDPWEAEKLSTIAWGNWSTYNSREEAERDMREAYGFIEWFFFGWQIIQLIRLILSLLYPEE